MSMTQIHQGQTFNVLDLMMGYPATTGVCFKGTAKAVWIHSGIRRILDRASGQLPLDLGSAHFDQCLHEDLVESLMV